MPKPLNLRADVSTWSGGASQDHLHAWQCLASWVWWQGARSLCQHGGLVFPQISWLLQVSMGTTPTETLSVAGNIFVGQVRSWAADPAPWCLQLSLPWIKGLLPPYETCGPVWPHPKDSRVFSSTDRSPAAHPPIPRRHDPVRDPCCDGWWLFHHRRQRDGCLHILWGECTSSWIHTLPAAGY